MYEYLFAARLVHLSALILLCGASVFRLYARLSNNPHDRSWNEFDTWLRRLMLFAAVAVLLSALAWWDSLAVYMSDDWSGALDFETLGTVLFETQFGRVWIWRLTISAAVVIILLIQRPPSQGGAQNALIAGLAAALIASNAGAGHAAMHTGGPGTIHQIGDGIHLLCAGVWLGGLVPLGYVLGRARRDVEWLIFARTVLPRFSRIGYIAVALLLVTGCINSFFLVSGPARLIETGYGSILSAKVCLFVLMVGLAFINRVILVPKIAGLVGVTVERPLTTLWVSVIAEQSIGLAVIVLVGVLGLLPPAH